jgi:hypothetical protein
MEPNSAAVTIKFRFKGTPMDRPGGPWWTRTFRDQPYYSARTQAIEFKNALEFQCEEIYEID